MLCCARVYFSWILVFSIIQFILYTVFERTIDRADHPTSYLDTLLIKTGSESIEATLRRRRILFVGFVARMEDTRLPKCVMFCGLRGGPRKRADGVYSGQL